MNWIKQETNSVKMICVNISLDPNNFSWWFLFFDPLHPELGFTLENGGQPRVNSIDDDLSGLALNEVDIANEIEQGTERFDDLLYVIFFRRAKSKIEILTSFEDTRKLFENKRYVYVGDESKIIDFTNEFKFVKKSEIKKLIAPFLK